MRAGISTATPQPVGPLPSSFPLLRSDCRCDRRRTTNQGLVARQEGGVDRRTLRSVAGIVPTALLTLWPWFETPRCARLLTMRIECVAGDKLAHFSSS